MSHGKDSEAIKRKREAQKERHQHKCELNDEVLVRMKEKLEELHGKRSFAAIARELIDEFHLGWFSDFPPLFPWHPL